MQRALWLVLLLLGQTGCHRTGVSGDPSHQPLTRIVLVTDWYAEADHGGFYQALAKGYYREAGLDVSIEQGGPMMIGGLKLATGRAQFGIGNSDETILQVARDVPVVIVAATMQHDALALLIHAENRHVNTFQDLAGRSVMTVPGSRWVDYVQKMYRIHFSIIPLNLGMSQFMSDSNFVQQCYVTNEPYYVQKHGGKAKTILISSTGFDPYRVIAGNADFVAAHPEATRAFVQASIRGWQDYLEGDPGPANRMISALNLQMTPDFLAYGIATLKRYRLVTGDPAKGEANGLITRHRLQEQIDALRLIGALDRPITVDDVANFSFLPTVLTAAR
jgi:NitT/TauT family transport system substrate-binding protein